MLNPIASAVLYLSWGVGGPTVVTQQLLSDQTVAKHGWYFLSSLSLSSVVFYLSPFITHHLDDELNPKLTGASIRPSRLRVLAVWPPSMALCCTEWWEVCRACALSLSRAFSTSLLLRHRPHLSGRCSFERSG